jgi:hypothetical protein
LALPFGVTVAPDGRIWVTDAGAYLGGTNVSRIARIDPVTGVPTIVSTDTNLTVPSGLAMENSGMLLASDFLGGVLGINPTNGSQTVLTAATNLLANPIGVALGTNGMVYVADLANTNVVQVDPLTGAQRLFAGGFTQLFGIAVVSKPANPRFNHIVRILPATGTVAADFQGLAGQSYALERTTAFVSWDEVDIKTAGPDGMVHLVDSSPPAGGAFYRVRWP